jgi:hypothetical protein
LVSQSVGMLPGDKDQPMILDSVGDGMCCGYIQRGVTYGEGSTTHLWTILAGSLVVTSSNDVPITVRVRQNMRNLQCIVSQIYVLNGRKAS